jgi:hypothetical protein
MFYDDGSFQFGLLQKLHEAFATLMLFFLNLTTQERDSPRREKGGGGGRSQVESLAELILQIFFSLPFFFILERDHDSSCFG